MSHRSYDSNLSQKRLILVGAIRSRSCPNIGDSYGIFLKNEAIWLTGDTMPCRKIALVFFSDVQFLT